MGPPPSRPLGDVQLSDRKDPAVSFQSDRIEESIEYLELKADLDSRSLNPKVWERLWQSLGPVPHRTLELGAGIGTMIERVVAAGRLTHGEYVAVDHNSLLLAHAGERLRRFAQAQDLLVQDVSGDLRLHSPAIDLLVRFVEADITDTAWSPADQTFDLLIAHAVLDLIDLPTHLPRFMGWLRPGGVAYLTLTFDGVTAFLPEGDPALDQRIEAAFHATMDARRTDAGGRSGGHRSGRELTSLLMRLDAVILAAGASDWFILPRDGTYRAGEQAFLGWMLRAMESALASSSDIAESEWLDWIAERRRQLNDRELGLITHQVDVCAQVAPR